MSRRKKLTTAEYWALKIAADEEPTNNRAAERVGMWPSTFIKLCRRFEIETPAQRKKRFAHEAWVQRQERRA